MKQKRSKIIYWVATGLLTAMMLMTVGMYFFAYEETRITFSKLGVPSYVIYPLAILKILGLAAILTKKSKILKDLAYAGFFLDFALAISVNLYAKDGEFISPTVAVILLITSYIFEKRVNVEQKN